MGSQKGSVTVSEPRSVLKNGSNSTSNSSSKVGLRLLERRKHPRFLLSGELFRELKSGKIFPVFDLSISGLSLKVDEKVWPLDSVIKGTLNLHSDSIEVSARVLGYYGDRAALRLEVSSIYARSVLQKALSPKRLGASLKLIRESLPFTDFWFHGACNTDLLVKTNGTGEPVKVEVFFSNFYCSWSDQCDGRAEDNKSKLNHQHSDLESNGACFTTGVCQSMGMENREDLLLAEEPIKLESIHIARDQKIEPERLRWACDILEASKIDDGLKSFILKKFQNFAGNSSEV